MRCSIIVLSDKFISLSYIFIKKKLPRSAQRAIFCCQIHIVKTTYLSENLIEIYIYIISGFSSPYSSTWNVPFESNFCFTVGHKILRSLILLRWRRFLSPSILGCWKQPTQQTSPESELSLVHKKIKWGGQHPPLWVLFTHVHREVAPSARQEEFFTPCSTSRDEWWAAWWTIWCVCAL